MNGMSFGMIMILVLYFCLVFYIMVVFTLFNSIIPEVKLGHFLWRTAPKQCYQTCNSNRTRILIWIWMKWPYDSPTKRHQKDSFIFHLLEYLTNSTLPKPPIPSVLIISICSRRICANSLSGWSLLGVSCSSPNEAPCLKMIKKNNDQYVSL